MGTESNRARHLLFLLPFHIISYHIHSFLTGSRPHTHTLTHYLFTRAEKRAEGMWMLSTHTFSRTHAPYDFTIVLDTRSVTKHLFPWKETEAKETRCMCALYLCLPIGSFYSKKKKKRNAPWDIRVHARRYTRFDVTHGLVTREKEKRKGYICTIHTS